MIQHANEVLGREHTDESHPYVEAKQIVPMMRHFTEAIIRYFRSRGGKEEL